MRLVKAFGKINQSNYRLLICGAGDTEPQIRVAAAADHRIEFKGQLPRSDVLALQRNAALLVNPRTPEGEFTRYSFPSKTMEYLASSIPVLMHRLDGVPEDYFNFCYTIDELSIDYLAKRIVEICETSPTELQRRVAAAKKFVTEHKSPDVQCRKIERVIGLIMSAEMQIL
jgi:glycosyltransferase involved in cell wall biosynthesis